MGEFTSNYRQKDGHIKICPFKRMIAHPKGVKTTRDDIHELLH